MILAGDIGGTKTDLALFHPSPAGLKLVREFSYQSRDFGKFDALLTHFLKGDRNTGITKVCLGVAGPVQNGHCRMTNGSWEMDEHSLARQTHSGQVRLLNDLQAIAYGMLFLKDTELATLNPGQGDSGHGNIAVIAAGTGLGEAFLFWDGQEYCPVASEGGHVDFAPQTDQEAELMQFLAARFGHVSYERLLSGPGLMNIYQFLQSRSPDEEPAWLREEFRSGDPHEVITRTGLRNAYAPCTQTLDWFASIYGAEAGNLALKVMATRGIYLAGGIAVRVLDKLKDGTFLSAFTRKGRYSQLMCEIPVHVALNTQAGLTGAAYYALHRMD